MREKLREGSDQAASALGRHVAAGRDLVESADPQRCIASMRANDVVDRYFARTYLVDAAGPGQDQFVHWHSNKLSVVGLSPAHPLVAQARARLAEAGPGAKGPADASPGGLPPALQAVLAGREAVAVPDDSCQASVAEGRFIKRIEYKVGAKRPTGKRKKGAESLAPGSTLCVVTDTAGQQHPVVACGRPAAWRVALPLPPNRSHPRSRRGMRCSVLEINNRLLANPDLLVTHVRAEAAAPPRAWTWPTALGACARPLTRFGGAAARDPGLCRHHPGQGEELHDRAFRHSFGAGLRAVTRKGGRPVEPVLVLGGCWRETRREAL